MAETQGILFTAFEPSGDALAAKMIARLRQVRPDLHIWGYGGPRMEAAGAELLETTTRHAVMLVGAAQQAMAHRKRLERLRATLQRRPIAALVPVDSPAANWSICDLVRRTQPGAKIVHLAAPQLWAWAPWRVRKLRRLTDHVLCLLPFEPEWFARHNVPATFVGHPIFENGTGAPRSDMDGLPVKGSGGWPRIALLPGSRPGEWQKNWPTMLRAYTNLLGRYLDLVGVVAAVDAPAAEALTEIATRMEPDVAGVARGLQLAVGRADDVIAWADVVLAVSGTVTLQVAAHRKPMIVLYNVNPFAWHLAARWFVWTRTFSLPNLIAQSMGMQKPVTELVPHFGSPRPVADHLDQLIRDEETRTSQIAALDQVCVPFAGHPFAELAAAKLLEVMEGKAAS
ncbi:MAG: hypothetical protein K8S99_02905 [Planctomycetes bacterium]|nr:hypothetical protein [Planctomycetota bacterium]